MTKPLKDLLAKLPAHVVEEAERGAALQRPIVEALIALQELQQQIGISQVDLAKALGVQQSAVSRLLRRKDMKLSTLEGVIQGMGGELQLVAKFSGASYQIAPFWSGEEVEAVSAVVPAAQSADFCSAEPERKKRVRRRKVKRNG